MQPFLTTRTAKNRKNVSAIAALFLGLLIMIGVLSPEKVHAQDFGLPPLVPVTIGGNTYTHYAYIEDNFGSSTLAFFNDSAFTPGDYGTVAFSGVGTTTIGTNGWIGTGFYNTTITGFTNNPYLWTNVIDDSKLYEFTCIGPSATNCSAAHNYNFIGNAISTAGHELNFHSDLRVHDYSIDSNTYDGDGISNKTRIISMEPENGTTTTNLVNFAFHAYINPADMGNVLKINIFLHNIDQNVAFGFNNLSPSDHVFINTVATTSGDFYFATSTYIADGNYRLSARVENCLNLIFNCASVPGFVSVVASTQFIVNNETFIGHISQQSAGEINNIFSSTTATSTSAIAGNCNPLSFDTTKCLAFLFIPDSGYLNDSLETFRTGAATHFPLGYVTDFLNIISTSSAGSLVLLDIQLPNGIPGTNSRLKLDLTGALDPLLNATSSIFNNISASSTQTFYEITSYYWTIAMYLGAVIYMIGRILGNALRTRNHFGEKGALSDSSSKDDNYKLKEALYKMSKQK